MSDYQSDPRGFALQMAEDGIASESHLLMCCLKYMSHDDVRDMLSANELAPCQCEECETEVENVGDLCDECRIEQFIDEHSDGYDSCLLYTSDAADE